MKFYLKLALKYLPAISIIALGWFLFNIDLVLEFPNIKLFFLILSFILLVLVFLTKGLIWFIILKINNYNISLKNSVISQFKTILTKYIPGNIWIILGPAGIVNSVYGFSLKRLSYISLIMLIVNLFCGLLVGIFGIIIFSNTLFVKIWGTISLILMILIILVTKYYTSQFFNYFKNIPIIGRKLKIELPDFSLNISFSFLALNILQWLLLGFSYYLFILGLGYPINGAPVLLQPLANCIGILIPISPGGLGIREAIMAYYINSANIELAAASSIAILARIWFVIAEVLVFVSSFILSLKKYGIATHKV